MDFASPRAAREMYSRAAWTIGFALVVYFINRAEYPGPAAVLTAVLVLIGVVMAGIGYGLNWISTEGQKAVYAQILDGLALQGSERVLCLSHELGLEAAKRLKSGRVISIGDTESNEAARELAKNQGLVDRIRFEAGDVSTKLTYPDANFDVVLASRALADLNQDKAIGELTRVLKAGGRLSLHETEAFASCESAAAAANVADIAISPTNLPLGLGGRVLFARKK
ncbi:MAG: class I SAM-dependent methyltransferase [Bryobacteraceae bacterium]